MVLNTSLLNIQQYNVSKVKWSNPGKGVVPSPTPWCRSYWKGSLLVTLDYSHQLITNNSFQYNSFIRTQLNGSKYCYVSLRIQINISHLFALSLNVSSIWPIDRTIRCYHSRPEWTWDNGNAVLCIAQSSSITGTHHQIV